MKTALLFTLTIIASYCYSQEKTQSYSDRSSIQLAVLPALHYNSAALGFGIKRQNVENVVELNSYYILSPERFAIGVHYNRNYYLRNDKTFIPLWAGINRVNVDNNYEDGGPYYDKMNFRIGCGIGRNLKINAIHQVKIELGIGLALRLQNRNSWDNESAFPFKFAISEFTISEKYPVIPAVRLKIRYDLRLGN